jgi:hypothetical protein
LTFRHLLLLALLLAGACPAPNRHPTQDRASVSPSPPNHAPVASRTTEPRLTLDWNARTGQGAVVHHLPGGDLLRTCFHCGYAGYTGGLVIGSLNGSGMGFYPTRPLQGFRQINVFCAQDESIWDHDEKAEYTYGWSENFGKGDDGRRLEYQRGRILENDPRHVVLQSENSGGCYRVTKLAYTRSDARWWILATRITNRCQHAVTFDFFTGDDPWIGLYRSSDGDVGWTPAGLVRNEQVLGPGQFTAGGLYDLGNQTLGQKEGSFSNQANFFALDPVRPLPDLALFANAFAHAPGEINPRRPLDNKTMTALNLGWKALRLASGEGWTTAMALGLAETGAPGAVPRLPAISAADWSIWRRYLKEDSLPQAGERVEFGAEQVELHLDAHQLRVTGTYYLLNRGFASTTVRIDYPILVGADRPAPAFLAVNGVHHSVAPARPGVASSQFNLKVPPQSILRFVVIYDQRHTAHHAAYMVTSALSWPGVMSRAVFIVSHPLSFHLVQLSYPAQHTRQVGDTVEHLIVRQPFIPDQEMEIRWR